MKKRLSFILALLLAATLFPLSAFAESSLSRSETYVNPLYRDIISEDDIWSAKKRVDKLYSSEADEYVEGLDAGAAVMREAMERRETDITVKVVTDDDGALEIIPVLALEETGVPTQGDYLRWTYGGWEAEQSGYVSGGMYYLSITTTPRRSRRQSLARRSTPCCRASALTMLPPITRRYARCMIISART